MMAQDSPGSDKLRKGMSSHGRGRRLETGSPLRRSRDDDLVLFSEMKQRESAKGDGGQDEYNWLLTPPGTPLISPDGDGAQPANTSRAMRRTQTKNEKTTQRTGSRLGSSLAPKSSSTPSRPSTPTLQSMRKGTSPVKPSSTTKSIARQRSTPGFPKDLLETSKGSTDSSQRLVKKNVKPSAGGGDDADSSRKIGAFKQTGGGQGRVKKRSSKRNSKHEKTCEEANLSVADKACIDQDTSYLKFPSPEFYFHLPDSPVAGNLNDEKSKKCDEVFLQNHRNGMLDDSSVEGNHLQDDVGHQDSSSGAATQNPSDMIPQRQPENCFQNTSSYSKHPPFKATVTTEALRKRTHKNFTMEETADNIIFCSSIAHDLACRVASMVVEKEMPTTEASHPTVTHLTQSVSFQKNFREMYYKRIKYSRKLKKKRQEIDSKKVSGATNARTKELAFSNDITKPPKLESKCNCTVM